MSEIKHPPVDFNITREIGMDRIFAEEAFQLLMAYGCEHPQSADDIFYKVAATDPVDLTAADATDIAFRLKGVPVFDLSKGTASSDYFVMELQHGVFDGSFEAPTEEAYHWQPYLRMVLSTENSDDIYILDAQSYQKVEGDDLAKANFLLTLMRQEYRGMEFEDEKQDAADIITRSVERTANIGGRLLKSFDLADFYDVSPCDVCQTNSQACAHNPETLN